MAGPLAIVVPVALLVIGGLAAAGAAKKKKEAAPTEPGAITPGVTVTPGVVTPTGIVSPAAAVTPGVISVPSAATPAGAAQQAAAAAQSLTVPSDIQAMVVAALASQNPITMRRVADAIQAKYPTQATELRNAASVLETAIAAQQAAAVQQVLVQGQAVQSPGVVPQHATGMVATPAGDLAALQAQAAQVATQLAQAAGQPVAVPATVNIPTPTPTAAPPVLSMPTPTPAPASTIDPGRARAESLALKLKFAVKGKEDKPAVADFQKVERLSRTDGSYGSETAIALADRYGIVPPKPLYWGKKGGDYQTLVNDKKTYSTHLLVLADKDPQRADEWRAAAKV
jgi:hypothetical protein